ncbi:glycosyltransferase [Psychrobacter pacificensis]|uniref:glycosyltransferase n=1 Tax=Psychrobacter pacificensis TaxID=112002 RepID=UPI003D083546
MLDKKPLVTVYIPTYNRLELLNRAVKSVLNQTYKNLEIIIVDDCSVDGTIEYLKKISAKEKRIKYFLKEKNSGACASRNIAIKNAEGYFITGLDDDDYFEKKRVELFVSAAVNNKNAGYFTHSKVKISEKNIVKPRLFANMKRTQLSNYKDLLKQNFIGNQVFIRTSILQEAGGFDESLKAWQDLECWINLIKTQKIKMKRVKSATQVVDLSHDHERITKSNIHNVTEAFDYICEKHNLNFIERIILKGQLIQYLPSNFNKFNKVILFLLTGQLFYIKAIYTRGNK